MPRRDYDDMMENESIRAEARLNGYVMATLKIALRSVMGYVIIMVAWFGLMYAAGHIYRLFGG